MTEHEYKRLTQPVDLAAMRAKLSPESQAAAEAMSQHMRLSHLLTIAIADRDQNAKRRLLRARKASFRRIQRRSEAITTAQQPQLGNNHHSSAMPRKPQPPPLF